MKLGEYLKQNVGKVAKVGAAKGFLFAWEIPPQPPAELADYLDREIIDRYPSLPEIGDGEIVIFEGKEWGNYALCSEYGRAHGYISNKPRR